MRARSIAKHVLIALASSEIVIIPALIVAGAGAYAIGLPPFETVLVGLMLLSVVGCIWGYRAAQRRVAKDLETKS